MLIDLSKILVYEMPEIHYFDHAIDVKYSAIQESMESQESSLQKSTSEFKKKLMEDPSLKQLNERDRASYFDQMYSYEDETIIELEYLQRNATCQVIFASFEGQLQELCEIVERHFVIKTPLKKIKGDSEIDRYWKFLKKNMVEIPEDSDSFVDRIVLKKQIRNKLAHQNGIVYQEFIEKCATLQGIVAEEFGAKFKIKISGTEFLIELIKEVQEFLSMIITALDHSYRIKKG